MKFPRVYLFLFLLLLATAVSTTGCARKSGCHAIEQTTKPPKKQKTKTHLFGKKTRRRMGR